MYPNPSQRIADQSSFLRCKYQQACQLPLLRVTFSFAINVSMHQSLSHKYSDMEESVEDAKYTLSIHDMGERKMLNES